ncbi:cold-shock protein [Nisaea sp.]|uniref:cold-shock protein n=1 Tax=Nisaea sp. TaxID=2024842 RepID=UPI003B523CC5
MPIGTVKFFKTDKGYGFITPEDGTRDVFVHVSAVQNSGLATISEGQRLNFEVQEDARGPKAINLSIAD